VIICTSKLVEIAEGEKKNQHYFRGCTSHFLCQKFVLLPEAVQKNGMLKEKNQFQSIATKEQDSQSLPLTSSAC